MIKYMITRQQYEYCANRIIFRRLWVHWLICVVGAVLTIMFSILWKCVDEKFFNDFTRSIGFTVTMIIIGIILYESLVARALKRFKPTSGADCLEYSIAIENDLFILQTSSASYRSYFADIKIHSYKKFYTIQTKEYNLIVLKDSLTTDIQHHLEGQQTKYKK